jgi:hypothetical protein
MAFVSVLLVFPNAAKQLCGTFENHLNNNYIHNNHNSIDGGDNDPCQLQIWDTPWST